MTPTSQQLTAIRTVARAILDAVRSAGDLGAPAGAIQFGLASAGCSYAQCHRLIAALVRAGYLDRRGNLLVAAMRPH